MLVELFCLSNRHLYEHHVEGDVCFDGGCIGILGCQAIQRIESLCMEPTAGRLCSKDKDIWYYRIHFCRAYQKFW